MQICFFSDKKSINLKPLTLTRPADDLRLGIFTIRRKWELWLKANNTCRIIPEEFRDVFPAGSINPKKSCLWINSRYLPSRPLISKIEKLNPGEGLGFGSDIIAALTEGKASEKMHENKAFDAAGVKVEALDEAYNIENLWDMLELNAGEIERDIEISGMESISNPEDLPGVHLHNPQQIFIHEEADVEPGTSLVAKDGPIVIEKGAMIQAGTIIRGPVAICEEATIMMGAQIYGGATIGPVCKVGGTVGKTIFHSYSNKAHDGFTGNSIFGQWVNLGADTNTSNLKNNYSTVQIPHWDSGQIVETGIQFLGTVMADHSKTAINTMLNTGTVCGVSSNIFMSGFPPKRIPSFAWVPSEEFVTYRFDKAVEAMAAMMERRNKYPDKAYIEMMRKVFENRRIK